MALLDGSPAVGAGLDPVVTFVGNDFEQRGVPWVRNFGNSADIGAFEMIVVTDPMVPTFTG